MSAPSGACRRCVRELVPVESNGCDIIGWQCPVCHEVSRSRMPPLSRRETVCPVCLRMFDSVRRHWSAQYQRTCERFYEAGFVWSRDRPAWAPYAERSA
jgi:hypothetical protein